MRVNWRLEIASLILAIPTCWAFYDWGELESVPDIAKVVCYAAITHAVRWLIKEAHQDG